MKKSLFLIILLLNSILSFGQTTFTAQKLVGGVNTEYNDVNPVIAPDGKTLYFNRINHPENTFGPHESMDIWYSQLQPDGSWTEAQRMPFPFNTARNNSIVSVSEDGKQVVIKGIYSKKKVNWIKRGLSTVTASGDTAWNNPQKIKIPAYSRKNKGAVSNAFMSTDEQTLVMTYTTKWRKNVQDIYVSRKSEKGKWSKPKKIRNINDYGSIEAPFLSPDNKYLYYSANRFNKDYFDIMRSSRIDDTYKNWTDPVVLNDTINSVAWDSYYKTNLKESWAYFCSDKNGNTKSDIYRVKLYEENPFVIVSGTVINTTKNAPLHTHSLFTIMADGKPADSVVVNYDSASFRLKLPLGRKYYINASVKNFNSKQEIIDMTDVREYTELTQDLYVTPVPYVLVQGKMLNRRTNAKIPASARPRVALDGVITDSVIIDLNTGIYKIKVPYGSNHSLQILADKYAPDVEYLNLNNITEYQEINKNLYVTEIRQVAILSGKILSRKSNKPLSAKIETKIKVNDVVSTTAIINKSTGEYKLELPIGQDYIVNASASKYFPVYELVSLSKETTPVRIYKDLYLSPLEVGSSVKLNNVFFETGKAALKEESFMELDKVVSFLNEYPEVKIEIGGHTDNVGKPDKNLTLSDQRAAAVANYILSKGISDDRISSKGYGQTKPVAPNTTNANKAKNRRVEFTILDI